MANLVIDHALLTRLHIRTCAPQISGNIVFFAIRGALPVDVTDNEFRTAPSIRSADPDHEHMRCTIGQWKPADQTVALFCGSTVPSRSAMQRQRAAGKQQNVANLLSLGHYNYVSGMHKADMTDGHRAFRQNCFFPVWRSYDDLDYDEQDRLDLGPHSNAFVWNNLHCAFNDNPGAPGFSSDGCQVVCGQPQSKRRGQKPETGPWRRFIEYAYDRQPAFQYSLYSYFDVGTVAGRKDGELRYLLRFGSTGDLVERAQKALKAVVPYLEVDRTFGRNTLEAVLLFQEQAGLTQDGVIGPNTAEALNLEDWPHM